MTEATVPLARASRPRLHLPGLHQASALYLLVAIFLLFGLWIPNTFLTATTFKVVGGDQVVVAVLALALLIPLTAGVFDLSVGNMLAFSLVIVSWFQANTGLNGFVSSVLAVLACGAVGFVSGLVVVRFRVDSFIATLGMSQILAAATLYISSNKQIVGVLSPTFLEFGRKELLGIPVVVYYLVALALVIWYVLAFTPLGRHLFATGANAEAARLSGVRTDRLVWGSLVGSGVIAGIGGVIYGAKIGSFSNSFGPPLLFPAFAAVFFGSTQFKSRPNVWGTLLAVYTLAFGVKGLQLAFASGVYWITPLFNGVALVLAVALAARSGAIARRRRSLTGPSGAGAEHVPSAIQANGALSGASPVEPHGDALRT
jgi:ribose transport system permease protein